MCRRQALSATPCAVVLATWGMLASKDVMVPVEVGGRSVGGGGGGGGGGVGGGWRLKHSATTAAQREKRSMLHTARWQRVVLLDAEVGMTPPWPP